MIKIRYGLPYKGSKNAIAEWIVEQLPEGEVLVDMFCGGGAHLEKGEGRFKRLKRTHPKLYDYCIGGGAYDPEDGLWKPDKNGLGMAHVFDELNKLYGENFIRYK